MLVSSCTSSTPMPCSKALAIAHIRTGVGWLNSCLISASKVLSIPPAPGCCMISADGCVCWVCWGMSYNDIEAPLHFQSPPLHVERMQLTHATLTPSKTPAPWHSVTAADPRRLSSRSKRRGSNPKLVSSTMRKAFWMVSFSIKVGFGVDFVDKLILSLSWERLYKHQMNYWMVSLFSFLPKNNKSVKKPS